MKYNKLQYQQPQRYICIHMYRFLYDYRAEDVVTIIIEALTVQET